MAKILVIDDDGIVRDALTVFLVRAGHRVVTAADGANGVQLFKTDIPDLVILDRNLPIISGSGVFEGIRKVSAKVPVIVLTGYDAPEEAAVYLKHGAASFLSKGDGLSNVLAEVDRVLGVQKSAVPAPAAPATPRPEAAHGGASGLVLIADDDESMLGVLSKCLTRAGYSVITAADGLTAERLALDQRPDIVLLDIFMPGKNGVDVLQTITESLPDTGVMMVSGNEDEEIARACLTKGAFDYTAKPPNLDALEGAVRARMLMQRGKI
ncbi:MAG: response regulator [Elusimicrobiales bacterium]